MVKRKNFNPLRFIILIFLLCPMLIVTGCSCTGYSDGRKYGSYNVTFYLEGKEYASLTSDKYGYFKWPTKPQKDNHWFDGWYYDSDLALLAGTDDVVKKNITLYPKMVKSTDPIAAKEGSLNYVSALDAETSHKITVKAPNLESVKNGVLFTSITDGNITVPFTVDDNGDGGCC